MSYIGQGLPADTFQGFVTATFAGDGSATTFTLSKEPFSEDTLIVVINNVIQKPTTNFTVSGTTLTIVGTAVADGDVIYAIHMGGPLPIGEASSVTSNIAITTSGNTSLDGGSFVFNESGADKDFRVEGDTQANLFFADASTDRVGIGTNAPDMLLDVTGSVSAGGGSDENLQQWNIASDNVKASMEYVDDSATRGMRFAVDSAHALHLGTEGSTNVYIQAG